MSFLLLTSYSGLDFKPYQRIFHHFYLNVSQALLGDRDVHAPVPHSKSTLLHKLDVNSPVSQEEAIWLGRVGENN